MRYDCVDGQYLYNRCHLIGYQLAAENANVKNLITGTRYLNMEGMLPFENMVADYVEETGNHVAYRVTPVFHSDDLLASGVLMEGYSIEDQGEGICFCIFAYNVQPGVTIDYRTGESRLSEDREPGDVNTVDVPLAATPAPAISMPPTATLSPAIVEPPSAGPHAARAGGRRSCFDGHIHSQHEYREIPLSILLQRRANERREQVEVQRHCG